MPFFKAPQYTKTINPKTGAQEATYIFNIAFSDNEDTLSFVAEKDSDISLQSLQKCIVDNVDWWNNFVRWFLQASLELFTKPYTIENINKIAKHTLNGSKLDRFPSNITVTPKSIQISSGNFIVNWVYVMEPIIIDIPDFESEPSTNEIVSLPVSEKNKVIQGIEELNLDDLPMGNDSTDTNLELESPVKFYDRQRVKEYRLKAKLALYKAQRQMAMYYDKYGSEVSESESEYNSSDDEISENEEVQL